MKQSIIIPLTPLSGRPCGTLIFRTFTIVIGGFCQGSDFHGGWSGISTAQTGCTAIGAAAEPLHSGGLAA